VIRASTPHAGRSIEPRNPPARPDPTFRALARTIGLLKRVADHHLSRFGISGSQWGVLLTLHRAEQDEKQPGLRLTDLGDRLLVRPPSVTGVVDRLDRLGLLKREPSHDDARAKVVSLTPAGRELAQRVFAAMPEHVESILTDLSAADRQELRRLLELVAGRLEVLPGGADHAHHETTTNAATTNPSASEL
jgi:DNA-binding MarR family transcriptional regulator